MANSVSNVRFGQPVNLAQMMSGGYGAAVQADNQAYGSRRTGPYTSSAPTNPAAPTGPVNAQQVATRSIPGSAGYISPNQNMTGPNALPTTSNPMIDAFGLNQAGRYRSGFQQGQTVNGLGDILGIKAKQAGTTLTSGPLGRALPPSIASIAAALGMPAPAAPASPPQTDLQQLLGRFFPGRTAPTPLPNAASGPGYGQTRTDRDLAAFFPGQARPEMNNDVVQDAGQSPYAAINDAYRRYGTQITSGYRRT